MIEVNNMKTNNSKITPKGYNSYEVYSDNGKQVNVLVKKSWIQRNWWKIIVLLIISLPVREYLNGNLQVEVHKTEDVEIKGDSIFVKDKLYMIDGQKVNE